MQGRGPRLGLQGLENTLPQHAMGNQAAVLAKVL